MKKRILAVLLAVLCLLNTGCSSILTGADVTKATVKKRVSTIDLAVQAAEQEAAEKAKQIELQITAESREKYKIGGTEAFYILPTGTPLPEMLLDFKVLDLVGDTTVYAYQALYYVPEDTAGNGLGGMPESGTRKDTEEVLSVKMGNANKIVTILMSYNTKTKQYKVFYHNLKSCTATYQKSDGEDVLTVSSAKPTYNDLVKKYKNLVEACSKTATGMTSQMTDIFKSVVSIYSRVVSAGNGDNTVTGVFLSVNDFSNIFTQKVNDSVYMIYDDGIVWYYNANGSLYTVYDLDLNLYNLTSYGGENAEYNVTKVIADQNLFTYMLVDVEKEDAEIDENTEETDLADENKDLNQLLLCNFSLNLGVQEDSWGNKSGYFVSKNENYETQVNKWKNNGEKEFFDLGTVKESFSDSELVEKAKEKAISADTVKRETPSEFSVYKYDKEGMSLELRMWSPWNASGKEPVLPKQNRLFTAFTNLCWRYYYASFEEDESQYIQFGGTHSEEERVDTVAKKNVTLKWTVEETTTDAEGKSTTKTTDHLKDVTLEATFTQCYRTGFGKDTLAQWSAVRYTADDIAPSASTGVVRYGSTTDTATDKTTSKMYWESYSGTQLYDFTLTAEGRARNVYMYKTRFRSGEEWNVWIMTGDKQLSLGYNNGNDRKVSREIDNSRLLSGSEVTSKGMDQLNNQSLADIVGESGDEKVKKEAEEKDTKVTVQDSNTADNYLDIGICFGKGDTTKLYLAGPTTGIIRYGLDDDKSSRISENAYYGIWMDQQKDGKDTTCKAIGYETDKYAYDSTDLFRAKLYTVALAE